MMGLSLQDTDEHKTWKTKCSVSSAFETQNLSSTEVQGGSLKKLLKSTAAELTGLLEGEVGLERPRKFCPTLYLSYVSYVSICPLSFVPYKWL